MMLRGVQELKNVLTFRTKTQLARWSLPSHFGAVSAGRYLLRCATDSGALSDVAVPNLVEMVLASGSPARNGRTFFDAG